MGKAEIITNLGSGQYKIRPEINRAHAERLIATYTSRAADLVTNIIPAIEAEISTTNTQLNAANFKLNRVIYSSSSTEYQIAAQEEVRDLTSTLQTLNNSYTSSTLQRHELQSRINQLQDLLTNGTITVWCADCCRNLTGTVGTMELYGLSTHTLIYPGYDGNRDVASTYLPTRDGIMEDVKAMTPEAAAYNFAIFPGWQKWRPQYRAATITHIYTDYCSVDIYDPRTRAEISIFNADSALHFTGVPVRIKNYKTNVLVVGDQVVLEFQDQDYTNPVIVGFYTTPCTTTTTTTTTTFTYTTTTTSSSSSSSFSSSSSSSASTVTLPPELITAVLAESAPYMSDAGVYYFEPDVSYTEDDYSYSEGPSPVGINFYKGMIYCSTGLVIYATLGVSSVLYELSGFSNQTLLNTTMSSTKYSSIGYDVENNRLIFSGTYPDPNTYTIYVMSGVNLLIDYQFEIPPPPDLKEGTGYRPQGLTVCDGYIITNVAYYRNDDTITDAIYKIDFTGTLQEITQYVTEGNHIVHLCMSNGNTGTLIGILSPQKIVVFDSGLYSPPTIYDMSFLPIVTSLQGITTNILEY